MKKLLTVFCILLFMPALVLAVDFAPVKMDLSAPQAIHYEFDGSELSIPVTVSGTPAGLIFLVFTKGKGAEIGEVNNGYLGWHYVNGVDTCLYQSSMNQFGPGQNTVVWDGKDQDGGTVPPGDYTYYMWAYDFASPKQLATTQELRSFWGQTTKLQEIGEDGLPMDRPFFHTNLSDVGHKWVLGNDTADATLLETTLFSLPEDYAHGYPSSSQYLVDPNDHSICYIHANNKDAKTFSVWKYSWVPNGEAERDADWGEIISMDWDQSGGVHTDGNYIYTTTQNAWLSEPLSYLFIIDFADGSFVDQVLLEKWFIRPDQYFMENGANYLNCGPCWLDVRQGKLFMGFWYCNFMMTDPMRYLESGDYDDLILWVNQNGDYINDRGWQEDHETPWLCFAEGPPHVCCFYADANLFSVGTQYDMGAVSFSLMGPDGSGIDIFAFAGETAAYKKSVMFCQNGSAYDGIYADNDAAEKEEDQGGLWFVGHDSITGTITSAVSVADAAPGEFAVAQNSPNPFNPTTTISFTLPEAGIASVEIYNVAGQKVDTIMNEFMDGGSHSVVWDASDFSAGVYFYTVKSGDFSRTIKMTLLK
jgi:hypothetical protein